MHRGMWLTYVPEKLSLLAGGTTGESILSIQPVMPPYDPRSGRGLTLPSTLESLAILLRITNATIIDRQLPFSDFNTAIDDALRCFIESQDTQFPLSMHANGP